MILKLKDILPNPFRDLKSNPLIEEKIVSLVGSIYQTGFWDNVVVRKNADGKYELAYGHHRLAAAIRAGLEEADFIVKNPNDAMMIQIMDNENRDTYGATPKSILESVKAVVKALASGLIPDFVVAPQVKAQHIRYAPSFAPGKAQFSEHPYTAVCISSFLGRAKKGNCGEQADDGVIAALDALYLQERGRFNDSLLITKDRTGAQVPITLKEMKQITSDLKKDVERVDKRIEESKKSAEELDKEQREIQAKRKEIERNADMAREKLVKDLAKAKVEENKVKAEIIKAKIKEQEEYVVEKALDLDVRAKELDKKVEERKVEEAAKQKVDEYAPIRREVERILHKLEGTTATTKEALSAEVKSLSNKPLNSSDRERLRQAALNYAIWYSEWVAPMFLPPLSAEQELNEYRNREAAKRRAKETATENQRGEVLCSN